MSIERSFLPSFISEPLPNCRSIWESAADSAFDLSMEEPSTIRRAGTDIGWLLMTDSGGTSSGESRTSGLWQVCTTFVLCSQYVLFRGAVLSVGQHPGGGAGLF